MPNFTDSFSFDRSQMRLAVSLSRAPFGCASTISGLLHQEVISNGWIASLIEWEEQERARLGLECRLQEAHIGRFNPSAISTESGGGFPF